VVAADAVSAAAAAVDDAAVVDDDDDDDDTSNHLYNIHNKNNSIRYTLPVKTTKRVMTKSRL